MLSFDGSGKVEALRITSFIALEDSKMEEVHVLKMMQFKTLSIFVDLWF
jgi:hypothetical protein